MGKGLGRRFAPDERDQLFEVRKLGIVSPRPSKRTYRYWNDSGAWLDQGSTSSCVGHAWAHYIEDGPITHAGTVDPFIIYQLAQKLDEWPGADYDGTSVRGGARAVHDGGWIEGVYAWAFTVEDIVQALLEVGPVVVGTDWYSGMTEPDEEGFLSMEGALEGGHAYLLNGVNVQKKALRMKNSWGREWGDEGRAWISFETFAELLRRNGEACLSTELKR